MTLINCNIVVCKPAELFHTQQRRHFKPKYYMHVYKQIKWQPNVKYIY